MAREAVWRVGGSTSSLTHVNFGVSLWRRTGGDKADMCSSDPLCDVCNVSSPSPDESSMVRMEEERATLHLEKMMPRRRRVDVL